MNLFKKKPRLPRMVSICVIEDPENSNNGRRRSVVILAVDTNGRVWKAVDRPGQDYGPYMNSLEWVRVRERVHVYER